MTDLRDHFDLYTFYKNKEQFQVTRRQNQSAVACCEDTQMCMEKPRHFSRLMSYQ